MVRTFHILGAGISGLILALELVKKGSNVRIYEQLNLVGGLTRTEIIDEIPFDCGPHLFHTNNQEIKDYWLSMLKTDVSEPELYGANYKKGKIYEYPISIESMEKQFEKNEIKLIKTQLKGLKNKDLAKSLNYQEYVNNLAGEYLSKLFFTKYPQKLWGISTSELSAKFAPRRIEIRDKKRPFHSGKGKWAGVLKYGSGTLANIIEKKLNDLDTYVEFNSSLKDIGFLNKNKNLIKELIFNNNKIINLNREDKIISTIPLTSLLDILKVENRLWNRCLKIVCLLVNEKIKFPQNYDWLYFDDDDIIFHRITLQDSFSKFGIPNNHSIISCEVAYNKNDKIDILKKDVLIKKCIEGLIKSKMIKKNSNLKTHLIDAGPVYPGINVGYEEELSKVKTEISFISNIYTHGSLAEYEYADTQVLTAKSIDLADILTKQNMDNESKLLKEIKTDMIENFTINETHIGKNNPCYIIAEIGLNHNGDINLCKELIKQASKSGVNAVKLQTYKKGRLSKNVRTSRYYEDIVDTQESLSNFFDRTIFSFEDTKEIFNFAKKKKITIFSTPFDLKSLEVLERLDCPAYKISSMDLVNYPLLEAISKLNKPMILSTGMTEISDIDNALKIIKRFNNKFALLHCVSSYPCSPNNANIPMIRRLASTFNCIVGYSDHTTGIDIALASIPFGAKIIEKHFTLNRKMDGPDHNFSIIENELLNLVTSVRRIEGALFDHGFGILPNEIETAQNLRRSLFYKKNIKKGSKINIKDLEIKSPGIGLHPKNLEIIKNKRLNKNVKKDFPVSWEDLS